MRDRRTRSSIRLVTAFATAGLCASACVARVEPGVDATASPTRSSTPQPVLVRSTPSAAPSPSPIVLRDPSLEPLPEASPAADDVLRLAGQDGQPALVSCGSGFTFDLDRLAAVPDALTRTGGEYDELRRVIREDPQLLGPDPGPDPAAREVARYDGRVAFLIDRSDPGPWSGDGGPYLYVQVDGEGDAWSWSGSGDCQPRAWGPAGYVGAVWALDPDVARPTSTTRVLHLLVDDLQCSSGRTADGRIGPAYVVTDRYEVHIELVVLERSGAGDCQGTRPTKATLELPEPLGDRDLVDTNRNVSINSGG